MSLCEMLFESSTFGMALVGPSGRPVRSNRALQHFLGFSETELMERSFRDFTHPEDVDLDWELFCQLTSGHRQHYQIDKRYLHKSGSVVWGRLTVSLVPGEPPQILGTVEDLSQARAQDQRQARVLHQLRERVKELEALHDLAKLVRLEALDARQVLEGVVVRVPAAFQFPERTAVRITVGPLYRASDTFTESPCRLSATADLASGAEVALEVVYWGKTCDPAREFLPEERRFLQSAAELIAAALDRRVFA